MFEWWCFGACLALAFVGALAMHWYPRDLPEEVARFVKAHPWELILRYVLGTAGVLVLFTALRLAVGDWQTPLQIWGITAVSGIAVVGGYLRDRAVDRDARLKMQESTDDEL